MNEGRRGLFGKLALVAGAAAFGAREAAAKQWPGIVAHPRKRFHSGDVMTAADLNALVMRIERLEAILAPPAEWTKRGGAA